MEDPYAEARNLGMMYLAVDHGSCVHAYKMPPIYRERYKEWVPSESGPWIHREDYLYLKVYPRDDNFKIPDDFTLVNPPEYYEKPQQWLYKPKSESQWKLHDSVMTQKEADAEFKPLGENWEYKKLT